MGVVNGRGDLGYVGEMGAVANGSTETRRGGIVGIGGKDVIESCLGRIGERMTGGKGWRESTGDKTGPDAFPPPSDVVAPSVSLVLLIFSSDDVTGANVVANGFLALDNSDIGGRAGGAKFDIRRDSVGFVVVAVA